jgi:uncharacterized protein YqjF (DUF2071 family)
MTMRWHDVLFLHWPVAPAAVRPHIPESVEIDTFDGKAWIGIVAFHVSGMRPRYLPGLAAMSFAEVDVRTYVWSPGRSGVWFLSVDAANRLVARAGKLSYGLPSTYAQITVRREQGIEYHSRRTGKRSAAAEFQAACRPGGSVYRSAPETLDRWLTDRYSLYGVDRSDRAGYVEIHHLPWPLQPAEVDVRINTLTDALGIELPPTAPLAHFAGYLEVFSWPFARVE